MCDPIPDDSLIFLPTFCSISSAHSNVSSLLPYYNMRRCPDHMCSSTACDSGRCCCQSVRTSSLTYQCPNERGILIPDIVEECGCTSCGDMPVVFVGMVTDTDDTPIPFAEVLVDNNNSLHTNEEGIFGFSLPASQEQTSLLVTATGFWRYTRTLTVMPGEVNVLMVTLLKEMRRTFSPPLGSFLISVFDLQVVPPSALNSSLVQSPLAGETFLQFPRGAFSGATTFVVRQVDLSDPDTLNTLGMSFVSDSGEGGRVRRSGEGEGVRREGVWGRVRRDDETQTVIIVTAVGIIDITRDSGEPAMLSSVVIHQFLMGGSCNDRPLLYIQVGSVFEPVEAEVNCTMMGEDAQISVTLATENITFPLTYLLAFEQDVDQQCYIVARSFLLTSIETLMEISTTVQVVTMGTQLAEGVNVMVSQTGECVLIPCQGEVTVGIPDGLQYIPNTYTETLNLVGSGSGRGSGRGPDIISEELDMIYSSLAECEERALRDDADHMDYFRFILSPRRPSPMDPATPDDVNMTSPPFCSQRVGVTVSEGVSVHVVAMSRITNSPMIRVARVPPVVMVDGEIGESEVGIVQLETEGSALPPDSGDSYIVCIPVSCDHQVTVQAYAMDAGGVTCEPSLTLTGLNIREGVVTFDPGSRPVGLTIDSSGSTPSIAVEMCKLGEATELWFQC